MFDDLDKMADGLSKLTGRWARHTIKKAWNDYRLNSTANRMLPMLAREFPPETADEIAQQIANGADPEQAIQHYRRVMEQQEKLRHPPPIHGGARWAHRNDFRNTSLLQNVAKACYAGDGLFFGGLAIEDPHLRELPDNWLNWNGEGHLTTLASTGSGKSRHLLIPNLLRYKGSCVVFDVKGELYNATSHLRRRLGPVYKISPFDDATHAFNPLSTVETVDDGRALAELLLPRTATGDARFYDDEAINFLGAYILYIAQIIYPEHLRTMDTLRERTAVTTDMLYEDLEKLSAEDMPRAIRRAARVARTKSMDKGLPSLIQSLNQHLAIWDNDGLMAATSHADFDFRDLKDQTATVYITLPLDKVDAYQQFAKLVMSSALSAMIKNPNRPQQPVLFVLDEFLTLGNFPAFAKALRTHRDAGVRLWFLLQDMASLKEAYPQNWETFFTQSSVVSYFGTNDPLEAEHVSKQTGTTTVAYESSSVSGSLTGNREDIDRNTASLSQSSSIQYTARPVATPDEVIALVGSEAAPGERLAISRIKGITHPILHVLPAWDKGEFGTSRFGGPAYTQRSELLEVLFDQLNRDAFEGKQPPLDYIAYQDYSMGRGGGSAFHQILAMYKVPLNAIVIMSKFNKVEEAITRMEDMPKSEDRNFYLSMCVEFLKRLVLHEMIHREVFLRTEDPETGHGTVFMQIANEVHARLGEQYGYDKPDPQSPHIWPDLPMLDAVHDLCEIEKYASS